MALALRPLPRPGDTLPSSKCVVFPPPLASSCTSHCTFFKKIFYFIYFYIFEIYLFLAELGLHCCTRAFSSCAERGLLFIAVCRLLIVVASLVAEQGL